MRMRRRFFFLRGWRRGRGERHRQPALAGTLALIAEEGGRRFYEGRGGGGYGGEVEAVWGAA